MIDWLGLATKPVVALVSGAMSIYDRIVGKAPTVDFAPGQYGVVLRLNNERNETVIVEDIDATPPLLGFSAGTGVGDIARAIVRQRSDSAEGALAVLKTGEENQLQVITFDPFNETPEDQKIKVILQWRASSRSLLSRRKISKTVTVKDVKDLQTESDRRRISMRPSFGSLG